MADVAPIVVFRDAHGVSDGFAVNDRESSLEWSSADYWRTRERAERAAAKHAGSPMARAVHQELAQEYAARVRRLDHAPKSEGEQ